MITVFLRVKKFGIEKGIKMNEKQVKLIDLSSSNEILKETRILWLKIIICYYVGTVQNWFRPS